MKGIAIAIAILMFAAPFVHAEETTALWNGKPYATRSEPPTAILDMIRDRIISRGVSQAYFDGHFSLREASITGLRNGTWSHIDSFWDYTVGNYSFNYWVTVENASGSLAVDSKTTSLHEAEFLIDMGHAEDRLKECGEYRYAELLLDKGGSFLLASRSPGDNYINLETGALYCGAVQNETPPADTGIPLQQPGQGEGPVPIIIFPILLAALVLLLWIKHSRT